MRIALFSGNYNYLRDGANQALNHLVRYLEGQGDQVRVYSPVTRRPAFEPSGALVPVPSVPVPGRGEYRLALGLPRSVRRDVERFSPHIIHVSAPDLLGTRAQTFAKRLDLPIVASLHTRFETYFDYYGLGWLKPALKRHLRRFYRRSDHVLAPTAALVQEMAKLRGDEQVSLWSRGVDRSLFDPARRDIRWRRARGFSDDEVVVLFFGRLVIEKGVETFISVVRDLQSRNVRVRPLVVGEGPARSAFAGLPGAVLTGHLEGRELGRAVASADILLNPSTTEAFGNVVLEAMASGLAVVSADAPSASALIEHGRTGLLCPPQDVASYGTAALSLISCERGDSNSELRLGRRAGPTPGAPRQLAWRKPTERSANQRNNAVMWSAGPNLLPLGPNTVRLLRQITPAARSPVFRRKMGTSGPHPDRPDPTEFAVISPPLARERT